MDTCNGRGQKKRERLIFCHAQRELRRFGMQSFASCRCIQWVRITASHLNQQSTLPIWASLSFIPVIGCTVVLFESISYLNLPSLRLLQLAQTFAGSAKSTTFVKAEPTLDGFTTVHPCRLKFRTAMMPFSSHLD